MFDMIDLVKRGRDVMILAILTDEMLLDSYHLAIQLRLENDFITLLLSEIHKRNLGFII